MLSSWLLQHYGVVVGGLSEDGTPFRQVPHAYACAKDNELKCTAFTTEAGNVIETYEHKASSKSGEFSFCPENAAAAIHAGAPGEVALVSWARRLRSRKRPALERESKVQKKE